MIMNQPTAWVSTRILDLTHEGHGVRIVAELRYATGTERRVSMWDTDDPEMSEWAQHYAAARAILRTHGHVVVGSGVYRMGGWEWISREAVSMADVMTAPQPQPPAADEEVSA